MSRAKVDTDTLDMSNLFLEDIEQEAIEDMPMDTIVQLETDLWVLEDVKSVRYYEEENRVVLSIYQ